jgi:RNA 3'-terminal phosphate cyclase (ATP)
MIHIDGSHMEGGGQIVRTALALSTLTGKPFRIDNIRHNRPKPGLKRQHISCIDGLKQLAHAKVDGARPGSVALQFYPGRIGGQRILIDIGTAGSITLLLQSLLLPCLFAVAPVEIQIRGGTDTKWSIPIDYFDQVILPYYNKFAACTINASKRGYYPKGQGTVDMTVRPRFHITDFKNINEFTLHLKDTISKISLAAKPEINEIRGRSSASRHLKGAKVAERQIRGAAEVLERHYSVAIRCEYQDTASAGSVITLWSISKGYDGIVAADALGEKGVPAEKVGAAAAQKLLNVLNSNAAVDHHLADNLVPLLALVGGTIVTDKITGHIRSNIYVCEKFLDVSFGIDEKSRRISAGL